MRSEDTFGQESPIVIGHRGASGARPEHTLEAYRLAIEMGADFIEADLVPTRDGVLIARHENLLAQVRTDEEGRIVFGPDGKPDIIQETTNVAHYDGDGDGKPDFADRLSIKVIDGDTYAGWFSEDFTLAEIKELRARERIPEVRPENAAYNDQVEIPTYEEVVRLVQQVEAETGRKIGLYTETKHPTYFALEGRHQDEDTNQDGKLDRGEDVNGNGELDQIEGGAAIDVNLGRGVIEILTEQGFTDPSRTFLQSFEIANLLELQNTIMPSAGIDLPLVQLLGDVDRTSINEAGGGFSIPYDVAFHFTPDNASQGADPSLYKGLPFAIDRQTDYGNLVTPEVLKQIAGSYAEGVGPWIESFLLRAPLNTPVDANGDGQAEVTSRLTGEVRPLVQDAHEAGLLVHPYTLRAEESFLALEADGTALTLPEQLDLLLDLGVDGIFTDHPGMAREVVDDVTGTGPEIRVATYNASLNRAAAGELIDDLSAPDDMQARKVAEVIQRTNPDIVLLNEFDYDAEGKAADLFRDNYLEVGQNGQAPVEFPYIYVAPSNTGLPSGMDLDNSGSVGGPNDAQGFGEFEGQYAFAVFSKHPILDSQVRTFQEFLWKDMPGALLPDNPDTAAEGDFYSEEELALLRLSSKNHVDLPVEVDGEVVHILAAHPTPPTFDGPEDRNGRRNHDEIRFWDDYVTSYDGGYIYDDQGKFGGLEPNARFVILGDYNADPVDGDSVPGAVQQLLGNPAIDVSHQPDSKGGIVDADDAVNRGHLGNPALDTADFGEPLGNLRVDYVLPSRDGFQYLDGGVYWPAPGEPGADLLDASDHRLVYADLKLAHGANSPDVAGVENLEFLGAAFLGTGTQYEGTEIGGLSALAWQPGSDRFFALSDSGGGATGEPRLYGLTLDLESGAFANDDVAFTSVTRLLNADGQAFPEATVDPEGLALSGRGTFYIASEGNAQQQVAPFVNEFSLDGRQFATLAVPEKFVPGKDGSAGVRHNLAFESLALSPNERSLYTATENALAQDGPAASLEEGSPSRIVRYDATTGKVAAEYLYTTDPVLAAPEPDGSFATNGLVEILALDDKGTLLALERSFSTGQGNSIRLYQVSTAGADDISGIESLADLETPPQQVSKELVFDFSDLGLPLDNIEGMTLGPRLEDGRQSLILVSDNNFAATQFTQLLAFAFEMKANLSPPAVLNETVNLIGVDQASGAAPLP
ncbi:esterase-like activity of phytase family protein [Indioceanicola profundi]|uniref:esterase-like activity of phytase family protein n=1 Tax=Indioceanicola profundi TaxID=2220096 RepID=UPI001CEC5902|nr:esterase-like activity of phytase family protein [Indioceanicola profundi]